MTRLSLRLIVILFSLSCHFSEIISFRSVFHRITKRWRPPQFDVLAIIGRFSRFIEHVEEIEFREVDLTAGAAMISTPFYCYDANEDTMYTSSLRETNLYVPSYADIVKRNRTDLVRAYQLGNKALKRVPEGALQAALALISAELVKREVARQSDNMPIKLKEIANYALLELDSKLEFLTSLDYDIDPFIKAEYMQIQSQQSELFSKYFVKELTDKVNRELRPILAKFILEPDKVEAITKKVNTLVRLSPALLVGNASAITPSGVSRYEALAIATREWNSNLDDLTKLIRFQDIFQNVFGQLAKSMVVSSSGNTVLQLRNDSFTATLDPYLKYMQDIAYLFTYNTSIVYNSTTAANRRTRATRAPAVAVDSWSKFFSTSLVGTDISSQMQIFLKSAGQVDSKWNASVISGFFSGEIWSSSSSKLPKIDNFSTPAAEGAVKQQSDDQQTSLANDVAVDEYLLVNDTFIKRNISDEVVVERKRHRIRRFFDRVRYQLAMALLPAAFKSSSNEISNLSAK